jgi:hypothetical protein
MERYYEPEAFETRANSSESSTQCSWRRIVVGARSPTTTKTWKVRPATAKWSKA